VSAPIHPQVPLPSAGQRLGWRHLPGAALGYYTAVAASTFDGLTLIVTRSTNRTNSTLDELSFFAADLDEPLHFPDWETLPYDAFSPHQDIISERLLALARVPQTHHGILVVPVTTLMHRLCPVSYVAGHILDLGVGDKFDIDGRRLMLEAAGYRAQETVANRGEYAARGSLLDIYPMGSEFPIRIDLFDDEIDSLRLFDPDSQRTVEQVSEVRMLPAREFPLEADAIARFRDRWHNSFQGDHRRCSVYQDVSSGLAPAGIEYYLPFFFENTASLFDYLPANVTIVLEAGVQEAATQFTQSIAARHESLRHDIERPILDPSQLYLSVEELNAAMTAHPRVIVEDYQRHEHVFDARELPDLQANVRLKQPAAALVRFVHDNIGTPILFTAETAGRRELLYEFLARADLRPTEFADLVSFLESAAPLGITTAPLAQSLWLPQFIVISESQILGTRAVETVSADRVIDPDQIIRNLTELSIGAPVVHIEHGIGRYRGLQTLSIDGHENEFLTLEYAEEARLYVPVTALHLISRYSGADEALAPLHRLGSDQWEKAKRRAAERVVDVAAELLDIYARRASTESFAFQNDAAEYRHFAEQFPFEVTPDQQQTIDVVLGDLASSQATDRLICGDVGFGKTEVAMRAAFVVAQNARQVVVLVPTTLLAQQHFETFRDRFADWPVQIEVVSRLRSDAQVADVQRRMSTGKIDILIGTHKLLSPSFRFKELGLVIIDEEHRFGVRQKERLRSLRAEVDVLALTATPIPRTLNMAMNNIRDLSIIATPPARRLSIKTFVQQKRNHIIREAISRELLRGGQVFYVHNEVRTIEQSAAQLRDLVEEARIGVGHGQMPKRALESVMNDFYHRQLNVLVCTTIIETGIDIPNANTIIIERADKFGLAQLHQLRGRVGRSHHQAYAYLLTPHPKAMTADAVKRLEAIEAAGELGVGFTLATHDMEIRGAGELLGDEQSGQIESVGFSLYMDLLNRAVKTIRAGGTPSADEPLEPVSQEVNLHAATIIPSDYLPDVHSRLIMYKRIANAAGSTDLDELRVEMIDRFGLLPEPVKHLFRTTELKLSSEAQGIRRIDLGEHGGRFEFSPDTSVDLFALVRLVQSEPATYRMDGGNVLRVTRELTDFEQRLRFADKLLAKLAPAEPARAVQG